MLRTQGLEITFSPGTPIENRVLRGLDLNIPTGQFVTVIGSNGAGKSTFLNAVSGDLLVDRGSIHIDGVDVTRRSAWQRSDLVARVFQDPMAGTCEALTIEENMALAWKRGEPRGLGLSLNKALREQFRDKLRILGLGLEMRLADRMGLLSGGQRQAVSLLMASLKPSRILLLDEHTAALDPKYVDALRDPAHIHAMCEEYRAAATIDREHDRADEASNRRIGCPPPLRSGCRWRARHLVCRRVRTDRAMAGAWADDVQGRPIHGGHFFPEQAPEQMAESLHRFFGPTAPRPTR